jgi:predicted adenine nucleotide alpha hydrolase (AANH) superfamily ATPase
MKLLLHICCGPCAVYPTSILQNEGHELSGYFYNPNIHPYQEFRQRLEALEEFSQTAGLAVDYEREYGLTEYLRQVVNRESERCLICYEMRLAATARRAAEIGAKGFTTTLLYSRYQKHEAIRATGERLAAEHGISFYYRDFREGWQAGIDRSKELGLYRQPYCGCIYSEQERYDPTLRRKKKQTGK